MKLLTTFLLVLLAGCSTESQDSAAWKSRQQERVSAFEKEIADLRLEINDNEQYLESVPDMGGTGEPETQNYLPAEELTAKSEKLKEIERKEAELETLRSQIDSFDNP